MEIKNAVDIIKKVSGEFKGTLADHMTIQEAIKTIENAIKEKE